MGKTYKDNPDYKKTKTPVNRNGFHTKNNTQLMGKRAITETTEEAPSGETSLPDTH